MNSLWDRIINFGSEKARDKEELRQLLLLNKVLAVGCLTLSSFIPIALFMGLPEVAISVAVGISLAALTFLIVAKGSLLLARQYFYFVSLFFVMAMLVMSGKDSGSQIAFVLLGVLPLILFRNTKWAFPLFLIAAAFMGITAYYVESHEAMLDYVPYSLKRFSFYINICSSMFLVFCVVYYFKQAATEYETTIISKNEEISQKNKDITDSIQYAKRIQNSILPSEQTVSAAFNDHFILYKPKDIVAGDFYWVEKVGSKVYFTIADCTGHGVPGALVSLICSNSLMKAIKELKIDSAAGILDKTAELLEEHFSKSEEEVKDGMDIAFCILDTASMKLQYSGANNPLYLIRNGDLTEIKPDKQPVGKHDGRKPFTNNVIDLQKGDCIYLFTDGYSDQFGGAQGKKFKYSRFKELLKNNSTLQMKDQQTALEDTLKQWQGSLEQVDDVCVMGVRV